MLGWPGPPLLQAPCTSTSCLWPFCIPISGQITRCSSRTPTCPPLGLQAPALPVTWSSWEALGPTSAPHPQREVAGCRAALLSPTLKPRTVGSAEGRLGSQWRAAPAWLPSPPCWTSCTAWERFGAQTTWDLQLLSARGLNTRPLGSPAQNCGRLPWLLRLLSPASSQTPGGAARARAQDLEPHPPPAAPCSEP